jgi:hypothetical protein
MQVKVNVHESKVEQLQPGMRARIRILDREKTGTVTNVANQPEQTGWFSANVKEYATQVRIDGEPDGLRPGMTAEVEILVAHLEDVLSLPVASVVEQHGTFYCWVRNGETIEKRRLELGMSNDRFIEVKQGVSEGDEVLLNPRAAVAEARAMSAAPEDAAVNVTERFGAEGPAALPGSDAARAPRGADGPRDAEGPGGGGPGPGAAGRGPEGPGAGPADSSGEGRRGGGRRGGGGDLMQLDADGDGKVSRDEAPERMRDFFDNLDTSGDGFIDRAEADAMRQRFRAGGGPGAPGGGPPGGGAP